jgi:hypothetical protein
METDALISTLARDPKVKGPPATVWLTICLAVALAYSVLAILIIGGMRQNFVAQIPWVAAKAGLSLLFATAAAPLLLRLSRPGQGAGAWLPLLGVLLIGCVMTVAGSLASIANGERMMALTGGSFPICAVVIPTLAAPSAAALFFWLRKQAPTQPVLAGMAAGVLSGAIAAMAYALNCPVDSAAFVATWYPLAITACAALGALAGKFALRW